MKSDVVVIGAGMAGLTTGALLAKQGKRVTVIEKGNQAGGRAYTYEEKGFTLNYGAHAVYRPYSGYLAQVMARLGREVPRCGSPDNDRSYWADGGRWGAVGSRPHKVLTTSLFGMRSKMALATFMLAVRGAKLDGLGDVTWRAWVDAKTKDAAVRRFAMALATVNTYTRPSGDLAARAVLGTLQRNAFAKDYVGYMHGGWRSMYETFTDVIETYGGAVVTGAAIDGLEHAGDGSIVAAISAAGERYEAAAFVCAIPPQDAPAIAVPGTPLETELRGWAGLRDVRALTIDLGLARPVRDDDLTFAYDIERDLYYSIHSETAADLAPAGAQLLHAMAYLSPEEAADERLLASRREALVAGLDRFFPGWRDVAVVERSLRNARVVSARATPEQFPGGRVPLRSRAAPNLYFAGDGRDFELNLSEIIFASAMEVADALAAVPHAAREAIVATT